MLHRILSFGPKNLGPNLLLLSGTCSIDIWPTTVPSNNHNNSTNIDNNNNFSGNSSELNDNHNKDELVCTVSLEVRTLQNFLIFIHDVYTNKCY